MIPLLVRNASINIITEATTIIFGMVLFMFASRILGPENIGIYSIAATIGGIWVQLPNFGFDKLVARDIGRDSSKAPDYFKFISSAKIVLAVLALIGIVATAFLMGYEPLKRNIVIIVGFTISLYSFVTLFTAFFRAFQRAEYEAYLRVILRTGNMALGLTALFLGTGLVGFSISQSVMAVAALFLGAAFLGKNFFPVSLKWDINKTREFLKKSSPFILLSVLVMLYISISTLLLNVFKGDYDTGIYAAAGRLAQTMLFFPTAISSAFLPTMSKLYKTESDMGLFIKTYGYAFKYLFIIGAPIAVGFTLLSDPICVFLYGEVFRESGGPLKIMGWAMFCSFLNFIMVNTIIAVGREKRLLYISGGGVLISILFNLWAIPKYGYIGAAFSHVMTEGVILIAHYIIIKPYLGMNFSFLRLFHKPIWAALSMGILVWLMAQHVNNFMICIAAGAVVYGILLILLKTFDAYEINLIKELLSRRALSNNRK